jgi:hypothetical protein
MRLGEHTVIALSRFCKPIAGLSLLRLCEFAESKSAEFLSAAKSHPEIVKEYNREYVILKVITD